jgi:hypothetical protein
MRKFFLTASVLAASLMVATSGLALEKTAMQIRDGIDLPDDWSAGSTCSIRYFNTCTGWLWTWSGWGPGDRMGTCFTTCCGPGEKSHLASTALYVWTAFPAGYGFTGTIAVSDADANCCPAGLVDSDVFFPISGWNIYNWNANVSSSFVVALTLGQGVGSPFVIPTDFAGIGPTGPNACGTCFPTTRPNHSYYYGNTATPLCPGSPMEGTPNTPCVSEFWHDALLSCVVSVDASSFGKIKNLYR